MGGGDSEPTWLHVREGDSLCFPLPGVPQARPAFPVPVRNPRSSSDANEAACPLLVPASLREGWRGITGGENRRGRARVCLWMHACACVMETLPEVFFLLTGFARDRYVVERGWMCPSSHGQSDRGPRVQKGVLRCS